ncbi:restriction endonuclease subunit S [Atopobacter sp. AH10]|uniref:restriction endonuclease subunit S n=1 Tax=Atopobacter sp. AH10 TaxID=2315861 RepID=UPI000EF2770C|nr:restriction endonuclease subunit S [Atopobacter sp. AH10]RLK62620.1 restriction endonuclease subunit S [Atopobacter sp. AH10]
MKSKLSDISFFAKGKVDVSDLTDANYISTENMLPNKCGVTTASSLPNTLQTRAYQKNDILVSNIRPYFKKIWFANCNGGCSNDVLVFRANDNIDARFLYYVLANDAFFDYSTATSKGTKMPRGDKTAIMEYKVPDFNLSTQKKISGLLSDIDDKITLNNNINKNLEEQAQALFDLFYDSVSGKTCVLSEIIDIRDGTHNSPKTTDNGYPLVTSKHLLPFGADTSLANIISKTDYDKVNERSKVNTGDILISMIGTVGIISYVIDSPVKFAIKNVGLFKTSQYPSLELYILYYLKNNSTKHHIEKCLAGSTQKYISLGELRKLPIVIPSQKELGVYNSVIRPIVSKIALLVQENKRLANIRDTLLPKLMSGELDVSDIDL